MITLRNYHTDDIKRLAFLANNPDVSRYLTTLFPYPYTEEHAKWWFNHIQNCDGFFKVIESNAVFVGGISIHPLSHEYVYNATVGVWLGVDYWGKGIASQALTIMTEEAFTMINISRIQARVFSPNIRAMKAFEKAGFHEEAVLRKSLYKNGQYYDEHIFSRLSNDDQTITTLS